MPCRYETHTHDWTKQETVAIQRCEKLCGLCPTETYRWTPEELFQHVREAHPSHVVTLTPKERFSMLSADKKRMSVKDGGWMEDEDEVDEYDEVDEDDEDDEEDDEDDEDEESEESEEIQESEMEDDDTDTDDDDTDMEKPYHGNGEAMDEDRMKPIS
ncbi:unnamed protein product [Neofusicoccum parvum]|uniref:Unnamed protein product n=1 Tax=Neofusicoccum parvum TaxID=310453 RepID=A0ACB5S9U1_9PEZI|nr:unnamed protein product [Neofusicoccum parvum]